MAEKPFTVCLAGVDIGIRPLYGYIYEYCKEYLSSGEPALWVAATEKDLLLERSLSEAEDARMGVPVRQFSNAYLETLAVYRKIAVALLERQILLFHGSCVAVDGVAYLFTAASGTGKSTHVKLWLEAFGSRAQVINDDKPLLAVTPAGVVAYGTPWDGKHRRSTNTGCPLKAICVLERSGTNRIRSADSREEYPALLQQVYRPQDPVALVKTLEVLDKLLSQVEIYRLGCNMDPSAALVSYRGMNGEIL